MRYLLFALTTVGLAAVLSGGAPVHAGGNFKMAGRDADRANSAILEEAFVPIGGIDQWISIRSQNRNNPVIVIMHGGPAVANSALLATYSGWEKYFRLSSGINGVLERRSAATASRRPI